MNRDDAATLTALIDEWHAAERQAMVCAKVFCNSPSTRRHDDFRNAARDADDSARAVWQHIERMGRREETGA